MRYISLIRRNLISVQLFPLIDEANNANNESDNSVMVRLGTKSQSRGKSEQMKIQLSQTVDLGLYMRF